MDCFAARSSISSKHMNVFQWLGTEFSFQTQLNISFHELHMDSGPEVMVSWIESNIPKKYVAYFWELFHKNYVITNKANPQSNKSLVLKTTLFSFKKINFVLIVFEHLKKCWTS